MGAIITPDPPGEGMMKAGTGPPAVVPGKGLLLGRPLPRLTKIIVKSSVSVKRGSLIRFHF